MRFGRRDIKEEFIFHGRPVVGWSSELLQNTLLRTMERLVVEKGDPLIRRWSKNAHFLECGNAREIGAKAVGLSLSGTRAGAMVRGRETAALTEDLRLASRLHLPLTLIQSFGVAHSKGRPLRAALDETNPSGAFQLFAGNVQEALDFILVAVRVSERALVPGVCGQDAIRTAFDVASVLSHENELVDVFLGRSNELFEAPTPAQKMILGEKRRRVPSMLDPARPVGLNPHYAPDFERLLEPGDAAYYGSHVSSVMAETFDDLGALTGRFYEPLDTYRTEDADYIIVSVGAAGESVKSVIDFTRQSSRLRIGAVRMRVVSPLPEKALSQVLTGKRAVTVLDNGNLPDGALTNAIRRALGSEAPRIHTFNFVGTDVPSTGDWLAAIGNMTSHPSEDTSFFVIPEENEDRSRVPALERMDQLLKRDYPDPPWLTSLDGGAQTPAIAHPIRLFGTRPDVVAEGAGLIAQAVATVNDVLVEGRMLDGSPAAYAVDFGGEGTCTGILNPGLIGEDSILQSLLPGSTVVLVSPHDRIHFWPAQPESFRQIANDRDLAIYTVPPFTPATDGVDAGLDQQLRVSAGLGAVLRAVFDGRFSIDEIAARLQETLTREGYPSQVREALVEALKHGFHETERMSLSEATVKMPPEPKTPWPLQEFSDRDDTLFDPARFWSSVGFGLASGRTSLLSPDPYLSARAVPAMTSVAAARRTGAPPQWLPENCTACGLCWTSCPHSAMPVTVAGVGEFIEVGRTRVESRGESTTQVQRLGKHLTKRVHKLVANDGLNRFTSLGAACEEGLTQLLEAAGLDEETEKAARSEFGSVINEIRDVTIARTDSFFELRETAARGSGQLVSINIDPDACTSCGICASICPEDALDPAPISPAPVAGLYRAKELASAVPYDPSVGRAASEHYPDRELAHRLIDKDAYFTLLGGGQADPGSGTRMAIHLVTATLASITKPSVLLLQERVGKLEELLRQRLQATLSKSIELNNFDEFAMRLRELGHGPESLDVSRLLGDVSQTIDAGRLQQLSEAMLDLEWVREEIAGKSQYASGVVAVIGSAPTILRDAQFASNPLTFPWINAGDSDPFALAQGVFEGMLSDSLGIVTRLRRATKLVDDTLEADEEPVSRDSLTDEELCLIPTVCVFVEELDRSALAAAGNTSPIRVFWLDRISEGTNSSPSFTALVDPGWCLAQTAPAFPAHFLQVVSEAATGRGPALVRIHAPEPELDGFPTHRTLDRMLRAVSSRVFPLLLYRPDTSLEWTQRWSLEGNPNPGDDWAKSEELTLTPADWFAGEGRFAGLFELLPRSSWNDTQVALADYLQRKSEERAGQTPYVEVKDSEGAVRRLRVAESLAEACASFRAGWRLLQEMAGVRSSLLEIARGQVGKELQASFDAEREQLQSEADARIEEIRANYEATFRDKLTTRLLALSGFDDSSGTLAEWLKEMERHGRVPAVAVAGDETEN